MELTQAMFETCDREFPQELNCELFTEFPFELSNFQKWAIYKMIEGYNTVLTAYTGSGKTVTSFKCSSIPAVSIKIKSRSTKFPFPYFLSLVTPG